MAFLVVSISQSIAKAFPFEAATELVRVRRNVAQGDEVEIDIAEVVDIIRQGGKFLVSSEEGKITGLEKVRKNQFLLTIEEFKELSKDAGCIDETDSKLQ